LIGIVWLGPSISAINPIDENGKFRNPLEKVASCAAVNINFDSCLMKNVMATIPILLNNSDGGFNEICEPPDIDEYVIQNLFLQAQATCTYGGIQVESKEVEDSIAATTQMLSKKSCWMSMCNDIENEANDTIKAGNKIVKDFIIESIGECSGVQLDLNSCIANTALDMILYQAMAGDEGERARRLLDSSLNNTQYYNYYGSYGYNETGTMCVPPVIDFTVISDIVTAAEQSCIMSGADMSNDSAEEIMLAINKLFSAESCWMSMCNDIENEANSLEDQAKDFIGEKLQLKEMSLTYVLGCASVEFELDSCLESSIVDKMLSYQDITTAVKDNTPQKNHPLSTVDEFGNVNNDRKLLQLQDCPIPHLGSHEVEVFISEASEQCAISGHQVSEQEKESVKGKMSVLFNAEDCWESICHEDSFLTLTSNKMQHCLNVDLPVTMTNPQVVLRNPKKYVEDSRLACMIDYVMRIDRSDFIMDMNPDQTSVQCFPPGFNEMKILCPTLLGPEAMSQCPAPKRPIHNDDFWSGGDDLSYDYGYDFSFSYEYHVDDYLSYDFGDKDDDHSDGDLINDMCQILEVMSSKKGQECLLPLCELFDSENGWFDPESKDDKKSIPSANPTMQPAPAPISPTLSPTASPTPVPKMGKVEIKFEAAIVLNMNMTDVPTQPSELVGILAVLTKVINEFLPPDASARILRIGDVDVARRNLRKLQEGLKVDFEVIMTKECDTASCTGATEMADDMYEGVTTEFQDAVSDGSLTTAIQDEAEKENIPVLQDVSVDEDSFEADDVTVKVETVSIPNDDENDDSNDDGTESSGVRWYSGLHFIITFATILFMNV
jgi:hypothetical protein